MIVRLIADEFLLLYFNFCVGRMSVYCVSFYWRIYIQQLQWKCRLWHMTDLFSIKWTVVVTYNKIISQDYKMLSRGGASWRSEWSPSHNAPQNSGELRDMKGCCVEWTRVCSLPMKDVRGATTDSLHTPVKALVQLNFIVLKKNETSKKMDWNEILSGLSWKYLSTFALGSCCKMNQVTWEYLFYVTIITDWWNSLLLHFHDIL